MDSQQQTPAPTFWSTVSHIGSSRKGVGAIVATVIGSVYALALMVSYFQGKMSPEAFFTRLQVDGGFITAAWIFYINGVAREDASAKSPPAVISAIGDGATAQSNRPIGGNTAIVDSSKPSEAMPPAMNERLP